MPFSDELLFERHHSALSDALALLARAIHLVIRRRPTSEGDPTPTSAHIVLKAAVGALLRDVERADPFGGGGDEGVRADGNTFFTISPFSF